MYYYYSESSICKSDIILGEDYTEIAEDKYNLLLDVVRQGSPTPREGYGYRLSIDGEWEEFELPTPPPTPTDWDITAEEALNIITQGYEEE